MTDMSPAVRAAYVAQFTAEHKMQPLGGQPRCKVCLDVAERITAAVAPIFAGSTPFAEGDGHV